MPAILTTPSVGRELLNVPFPEMVEKLALAIAHGQMALDLNSMKTAQALATTMIPAETVVVAIKETVDADGNVTESVPLYNDKEMPLLVYGLNPTFYSFAESIIEVKMVISMMSERTSEYTYGSTYSKTSKTEWGAAAKTGGLLGWLVGSGSASTKSTTTKAYASTVNAKYTSKYSFKEEGSSLLRTILRPVPPPERVIPKLTVVETP